MIDLIITTIFGLIVFISIPILFSLEYYARKSKVIAAPSVPWMRAAVIDALRDELPNIPENPVILELGAGWGTLAIAAAKLCPSAQIICYEMSPIPHFFAKLRAQLGGHKNMTFVRGDFFKEDFARADVVMTYLIMPHMAQLKPKFESELKPSAIVICNTFPVPDWTPIKTKLVQKAIYELKVFVFRRSDV